MIEMMNTKNNRLVKRIVLLTLSFMIVSSALCLNMKYDKDSGSIAIPESSQTITPPSESDISFYIGETNVNGKVPLNQKVSIIISADPDVDNIKIKIFAGIYFDAENMIADIGPNKFGIEIDTESYQGIPLSEGKYGIQLQYIDDGSPVNSWGDEDYTFDEIFEIVKQANYTWLIIIAVIAVVAVAGIVIYKKIQSNKLAGQIAAADEGPARKRKIYSGASQIGKRSGQAAEAKMQKRRRSRSYTSASTSSSIKKRRKSTSRQRKSAKKPVRSATKQRSPSKMDKLPEAVQVKVAESKVAIDKRAGFLDSKIDVLLSQVDLLTQIIPKPRESDKCNDCGNKIQENWNKCPYCVIKENAADIDMKESITESRDGISLCPKCGMLIKPSWVTCPKCLTQDK